MTSEPLSRPATMADVARLAGVSVMTVSRVLNGNARVVPSTTERVRDAMLRLNYRPNLMARGLASGRSQTIGLITFDTGHYGPGAALLGVERAARERGYGVTIATLANLDSASLKAAVESLEVRSADGVIILASHLAVADAGAHLKTSLPLVFIEGGAQHGAPLVKVDQRLGARLATEHLLGLGHETVWHIAGPEDWFESRERVEGWRDALSDAGARTPRLLTGDWTAASGYAAGQVLLAEPSAATAVFAANDQMALGLIHALFQRGMEAPASMSVVGFDDIPESRFFAPSLTTVRQDFDEMGRRSVELLVAMLDGTMDRDQRVQLVASELVIRASSGAPPPRSH